MRRKSERRSLKLVLASLLGVLALGLGVVAGPRLAAAQEKDGALTDVELEARRDRIRQYFKDRLARLKIVATTVTPSGQTLDWIYPASQTRDGRLATSPYEPSTKNPAQKDRPELAQRGPTVQDAPALTEVQKDPSLQGPPGTVPVVRFDVEAYLARTKVPPADPRDIFRKLPPPAPASNDRYYVTWLRTSPPLYGTMGRINIWDVPGPTNGETSIAQAAVSRGTPMQTVEAGKMEWDGWGLGPRFFTWFTTNGHTVSGDWLGGYNTYQDGFIQYSSRVAPGMSLAAWASVDGGNQYSLDVEIRLWQGNWWIRAAGEWVGYYPHCIGATAPPCGAEGTLFSESGIRDQVDTLYWYGEVFDSSAPTPTSTDMGSGQFASAAWSHAGYFRNMLFFWAPNTVWWFDSGSLSVTDATCYSGGGPYYSMSASWRNWFYFGGPGAEGPSCR